MSELTSKWITFKNTQSNFTLISLISFEVSKQTSPNLQGCCLDTSRWCLQNYMVNCWELTSELTSKWITFRSTQSNFTLSSLLTFAVLNQTSPNWQGSCLNTSRWCLQNLMIHGWALTSELPSKWITCKNTESNFTLISFITFEVLNQTLSNILGICRNSRVWCMQNYMENGWELTSELTSKWITFKVDNQTSPIKLRQINSEVAVIPGDGACKITWKTVENWRLNWRLNEYLWKYSFKLHQINSEVAVIPDNGACKITW